MVDRPVIVRAVLRNPALLSPTRRASLRPSVPSYMNPRSPVASLLGPSPPTGRCRRATASTLHLQVPSRSPAGPRQKTSRPRRQPCRRGRRGIGSSAPEHAHLGRRQGTRPSPETASGVCPSVGRGLASACRFLPFPIPPRAVRRHADASRRTARRALRPSSQSSRAALDDACPVRGSMQSPLGATWICLRRPSLSAEIPRLHAHTNSPRPASARPNVNRDVRCFLLRGVVAGRPRGI